MKPTTKQPMTTPNKTYKFKDKTILHILTKLKKGKTLSASDNQMLQKIDLCPADSRAADQMLIDHSESLYKPIYDALATSTLESCYDDLSRADKALVREAGEKSIMHITNKHISDYLEREGK